MADEPMKRLKREPLRFDLFTVYGQWAAQQGLSIRDASTGSKFLDAAKHSTDETLANDAFVHGVRVQSLFETVVAGLGQVKLLKQEDAGNAYYQSDSELTLPDYRLVLDDDSQVLVEVKNFYQAAHDAPYVAKVSYLRQLEAYARLTKNELLIAVYWTRWNIWTLVPTTVFVIDGDKAKLEMGPAVIANQMARVGDFMVAAPWPFQFRVEFEEISREGESRILMIRQMLLLCADRRLRSETERNIAMFLIFNGSWEEEEETHIEETPDGRISAVEFRVGPAEHNRQPGLNIVGSLSGMVSRFFRSATAAGGEVAGLHVDFTPGQFGRLIPDGYHSDELPLALLHQAQSVTTPTE